MKGIGTDIVQISRIKKSYERQGQRFLDRILTNAEQDIFHQRGKSVNFLANRFAAKEAIAKALGTGIAAGISFVDIQILPDSAGAPVVSLFNGSLLRLHEVDAQIVKISISDEKEYAVAFAVLL